MARAETSICLGESIQRRGAGIQKYYLILQCSVSEIIIVIILLNFLSGLGCLATDGPRDLILITKFIGCLNICNKFSQVGEFWDALIIRQTSYKEFSPLLISHFLCANQVS